jgi:protein TonB
MDRESKRLARTRGVALLATVILHSLLVFWALSQNALTVPVISIQALQVVVIEKPMTSRVGVELSPLQMPQLKPVLATAAIPSLNIPVEPLPPQAAGSEETPDTNASVAASNGIPSTSSDGSGAASNGEAEDISVARRVQAIYSDASVKAHEQGYVTVGLLIDEHGAVRKVQVVQSSGFRRLDQSAIDALRQWTFKRVAAAPRRPTWATIRYGFHLVSFNAHDLSAITLTLLPYQPELAEQIRDAALPAAVTTGLKPRAGAALLRLIEAIQTDAPTVGRDLSGPQAPVQLVIKLGAVKSVNFLNFEKHGLEVDVAHRSLASRRPVEKSQWEVYRVAQNGGTSEWLLQVTPDGSISAAQALICPSEQSGCPREPGEPQ